MKFINDINFYTLEVIAFVITLVINLLMLVVLDGEGDVLFGDYIVNTMVKNLGYCNLTEHEIYLCLNNVSNQIYCNNTVRSDYQYDSKDDTFKIIPGYIIDYSLFQFFCDYKNNENTFLITSVI